MRRIMCTAAVVLVANVAHAQMVTYHDDQTVTIRAEGVPIATLLSEIARVYPLTRLTMQPGVDERPVSIALERVPPAMALVAILKASGLDFAMFGRRIVVGDWTGPADTVRANDEAPELPSAAGNPGAAEREARRGVDAREAERQTAERAAAAAADLAAMEVMGDETTIFPLPPVPFIANGENVTYLQPNFVPYKMRPAIRALRMAIDVTTIP